MDTTRCENTNNDQLENYEDLNASVVTKNEEMKRKLLRYEDVIDENKELPKINDELKLSNSDMHTMNMKLMTRTNDLERENLSFRDQVNELSKRITSMDVNIDKLIDEKVHLENELELRKIEKYKFDEVEQSLTEVSEERSSKAEYTMGLAQVAQWNLFEQCCSMAWESPGCV